MHPSSRVGGSLERVQPKPSLRTSGWRRRRWPARTWSFVASGPPRCQCGRDGSGCKAGVAHSPLKAGVRSDSSGTLRCRSAPFAIAALVISRGPRRSRATSRTESRGETRNKLPSRSATRLNESPLTAVQTSFRVEILHRAFKAPTTSTDLCRRPWSADSKPLKYGSESTAPGRGQHLYDTVSVSVSGVRRRRLS